MSEEEHWSAGLQAEHDGWSPPPELLTWARTCKTPERAWSRCKSAEWLLWALAHTGAHRPTLVLTACDCARLLLPVVRAGDNRPLAAIEGAEGWARGEVSRSELDRFSDALTEACEEAVEEDRSVRAVLAAQGALVAVMYPTRASIVARQVVWALGRGWDRAGTPHKETRAVEARLIELVRSRPYPLLHPEPNAWSQAPEPLRVAWDLVIERAPSDLTALSTTQQICSWWTARSLGLDPADELARALAQRLQLAPELRGQVSAILGSSEVR